MAREKTQLSSFDRRRFLAYAWRGVGASLALALLPGEELFAAPRLGRNPFTLGVASGDPMADGAVLWTRIAPEPAEIGRLGRRAIPVGWRVATDPGMRHVVARGVAIASAELAHSVHVEVCGLRSRRDYFYQFDLREEESAIGHFRTAPEPHDDVREVKFAFATCQDWPSGHYTAYRDMAARDLDLVLHLGDYTYEYAIDATRRGVPAPEGFREECLDLRTYRLRHTLYKLDPDLQAVHAKFPFAVIWDDHEVANDYSGIAPEFDTPSPEFVARRAAAYQAYYEHMPIRASFARRTAPGLRIYRRLQYGKLVEFTMLDARQYRSDNRCGDGESLRCEAATQGQYTMLGHRQEEWVARGFARSDAAWNVVGQQLLLAELEHFPYQDERYWNDAWDGYPLARQRLLASVVETGVRNPVFLTGDWHSTFVNDLKLDFKDPRAQTVATEFVTPAITTGGDSTPYGPYYAPMIPYNPHIRYYEGDRRGYFAATVTPEEMRLDLRFVTSVEDSSAVGYTERSFVVRDGESGAQPG
jgi:alkaline phosphatase D